MDPNATPLQLILAARTQVGDTVELLTSPNRESIQHCESAIGSAIENVRMLRGHLTKQAVERAPGLSAELVRLRQELRRVSVLLSRGLHLQACWRRSLTGSAGGYGPDGSPECGQVSSRWAVRG
jgi:hypothetical protein